LHEFLTANRSPILAKVAHSEKGEGFSRMKASSEGLSEENAAHRWAEVGPNVVAANNHDGWPWRLLSATRNRCDLVAGEERQRSPTAKTPSLRKILAATGAGEARYIFG